MTGAPRIGLVGLFGQGNLGNDGSLEAMLRYLRDAHPDATIDVLCTVPDRVADRFGVQAARLRWYQPDDSRSAGVRGVATKAFGTVVGMFVDAFRISRWVRRHDVVIVPGMGVLEATLPLRPWRTPYLLFLTSVSGRLFGRRVALVSVGANVIKQRATRWLVLHAARAAHYRSFRDAPARDAMQTMGLDVSRDRVAPDLAFSLPVPSGGPPGLRTVGVGVMDYSGSNDDRRRASDIRARYTEAMTHFVLWLVDHDRMVRLLAGDEQDAPAISSVLADVRAQRPTLPADALRAVSASSLDDLVRELQTVETVVASRFHTVLCALKIGKPTLAVGYAPKFDALMTEMGLGRFSLEAKSVDAGMVIDRFAELEKACAHHSERITRRAAENARLCELQFAEMSEALFGKAPLPSRVDELQQINLAYHRVGGDDG